MLNWLSANLINIVLVAAIVLITGLLIHGMIRDKKSGKNLCSGNCASCGACAGCGKYGCCDIEHTLITKATSNTSNKARL